MAARRRLMQTSSASAHLRGFRYGDKQIAAVLRGSGTKRVIRFTDGSRMKTDRRTIHELAKLKGLLDYRGKYLHGSARVKKRMLAKSDKRQQAIFRSYLARRAAETQAMPASIRGKVARALGHARKTQFGSPLIGRRPSTSLRDGPGAFLIAEQAGVKFVTIGKGKNRRVVPIAR